MGITKKAEAGLRDLSGPGRRGPVGKPAPSAAVAEEIRAQGLELSDVVYWSPDKLQENPENAIFRPLKTSAYFQNLERDIREAGAILSPLIAMPDGLLIEGESRLIVARKLRAEGFPAFDRIPVRVVVSPLNQEAQRKRLLLGNLSRFEIDEDTRLALLVQIWPDFYLVEKRAGRPSVNTATVSVLTAADMAQELGTSSRQEERNRALTLDAAKIAAEEGAPSPKPEHIAKAREQKNAERREKTKPKTAQSSRAPSAGEARQEAESKGGETFGKVRRALDRLEVLAEKAEALAARGKAPEKNHARAEALREAAEVVREALAK